MAAGGGSTAYPSSVYANYGLGLLFLIYVSNQWSRYIINYLYAVSYDDDDDEADFISIKAACDLNTAEYGLLTGYGFSATFVITGLFMGRAADTSNRKNIITAGCLIWNIALMGMGMSSAFWELLTLRLLLGFGQAFSNPASYSMIADLFPPESRPTANGQFASGMYIGGGLASVSLDLATGIGWRSTCYVCAIFGGACACILFGTMKEPTRMNAPVKKAAGEEDEKDQLSTADSFKIIFGTKKVFILICAASIRFMGGYAIAGYLPYMYSSVFDDYETIYAYLNAYVVAFGGFCSSIAGGWLTSKWVVSQPKANYYVPAIGCMLGCPFITICCLSGNFYVSMLLGLFMEYLVAECWFGPYMSALQASLPPRVRGLGISVMMFAATFFGSLMSLAIGQWYDACCDGSGAYIRYIVLYAVLGTYIGAGLLFMWASTIEDEVPKSENKPLLAEEKA